MIQTIRIACDITTTIFYLTTTSSMFKQISFAQAEYDAKRKTTRRDRFLAEMEIVVPWARLLEQLRPHYYPEADKGPGRPPLGLELMLRLYFLQQ